MADARRGPKHSEPEGSLEKLSLAEQGNSLREECRMVLPGIQALFGFQLIAVFSPGFAEKLSGGEQRLHLVATLLVAIAAGLVMTPAAYHRQTRPDAITTRLVRLSSSLLLAAMVPLAIGVCADFYLIGRVILSATAGLLLAIGLLLTLLTLWFALPRFAG